VNTTAWGGEGRKLHWSTERVERALLLLLLLRAATAELAVRAAGRVP
jgi:hypothetical protein